MNVDMLSLLNDNHLDARPTTKCKVRVASFQSAAADFKWTTCTVTPNSESLEECF